MMDAFITSAGSWIDRGFVSLLLDSAVKSFVVLALAWSLTRLMRNRSAAGRHLVWLAASVVILVTPLFEAALPQWRALPPAMDFVSRLESLPVEVAMRLLFLPCRSRRLEGRTMGSVLWTARSSCLPAGRSAYSCALCQ